MITRADLKKALPDITSTLKFPGLLAPVEILRDAWGIPHVRAQNTHDAFFGQAFAAAQDRLWHMDYDRHRAHGRWAEFVGKPGLDNDLLMRRFRLDASARDDYAFIASDARAMLDAYAEGVNAFIQTTETLPVEYQIVGQTPEPWQPWDSLAVLKVRHILMGTFEGKLWRARLLRKLGLKKTAALHPGYQPGHLQVL
ncbi:MAG: penicillin acylase family protein, partial [SAR202 cluster bacterium]|nr:penicillin acylase family protein [SAR202 cluster bacterium]